MFPFRNDRQNKRQDEPRERRDAVEIGPREPRMLANERVLRRIVEETDTGERRPSHYRIRVRRKVN